MQGVEIANVDTAQMRHAGKELLSLALMDARNHSLRWAAAFEGAPAGAAPLLRELGRLGWFQEYWIARNVQRQRVPACDPTLPRLASVCADADDWYDDSLLRPAERWQLALPDLQATKQYLGETIDITLDLLGNADEDDATLHFFRLALLYEDLRAEAWAEMAQALGLSLVSAPGLLADIVTVHRARPCSSRRVTCSRARCRTASSSTTKSGPTT